MHVVERHPQAVLLIESLQCDGAAALHPHIVQLDSGEDRQAVAAALARMLVVGSPSGMGFLVLRMHTVRRIEPRLDKPPLLEFDLMREAVSAPSYRRSVTRMESAPPWSRVPDGHAVPARNGCGRMVMCSNGAAAFDGHVFTRWR